MSEPTIYRLDLREGEDTAKECVEDLIDSGVLVPVERCEHGNMFRHYVVAHSSLDSGWCPGAGIGDDDAR